jgi:hypothetical protein
MMKQIAILFSGSEIAELINSISTLNFNHR